MLKNSIPQRRCIACMESKDQNSLIRIVLSDGIPKADFSGNMQGRGAYICPTDQCIAAARKKNALSRAFKKGFEEKVIKELFESIENNR